MKDEACRVLGDQDNIEKGVSNSHNNNILCPCYPTLPEIRLFLAAQM